MARQILPVRANYPGGGPTTMMYFNAYGSGSLVWYPYRQPKRSGWSDNFRERIFFWNIVNFESRTDSIKVVVNSSAVKIPIGQFFIAASFAIA